MFKYLIAICVAALMALPAIAATPRQTLADAAFFARDKAAALVQVSEAETAANAILAQSPGNREAMMMRAMAIGYRAKLSQSRSNALVAKKMFEALAASDPHDPEAQAAVGAWNVDAVSQLGSFIAGAALGADRKTGLAAINRAVVLGGDRAMFPGLAALLRLSLNSKDVHARGLAEAAARGTVPTALDQAMQRSAVLILAPLRAGDGRAAQRLAKQLLPFGRISR